MLFLGAAPALHAQKKADVAVAFDLALSHTRSLQEYDNFTVTPYSPEADFYGGYLGFVIDGKVDLGFRVQGDYTNKKPGSSERGGLSMFDLSLGGRPGLGSGKLQLPLGATFSNHSTGSEDGRDNHFSVSHFGAYLGLRYYLGRHFYLEGLAFLKRPIGVSFKDLPNTDSNIGLLLYGNLSFGYTFNALTED